MEALFTTYEKDLRKLFDVLAEEEIQECCSSQAYYQGIDYFENGRVRTATFNSDRTLLTAKVVGSSVYAVQISLKEDSVQAACTCPTNATCKHIVSTMLYAINEQVETRSDCKSSVDTKKYLNGLPKEELVNLLLKYATDDLFIAIGNQHSSNTDALKKFAKVRHNLDGIFRNTETMMAPDAFADSLMKVIKSLSGLETKLPKKLGELIVSIIENVDKSTDEGYLYDHYRDYQYEPSEKFYEFVASVASAMDFSDKIEFIETLESAISDSSYSTFHDTYKWFGKWFTAHETPQLKNLLVTAYQDLSIPVVESYYSRVSSMLSDSEKENLLEVLAAAGDTARVAELAELLNNSGKRKESIRMLRKLIFQDSFADERLCLLYLDQMKAEGLDLHNAVVRCIKQCPKVSVLRKAAELLPSSQPTCEEILEKENPTGLLDFLESAGRTVDALALIKRSKGIWSDRVFIFYKKHKKKFPVEAGQYFRQKIMENLEYTGDYYYREIADALKHWKQIHRESAHELALHIRFNFRRRRNLIAMIDFILSGYRRSAT